MGCTLFLLLILPFQLFGQGIYTGWSDSTSIILNTSSSGAGVTETVTNFPVLIRLSNAHANIFSRAMPNGEDIRFSNAAGTQALSYQIESWSQSGQKAAIWVKVPTIEGNNSTQSIKMYWGKSGSTSQSNGAAVFDSSNGFLGVWHFASNDQFGDASGNNRTATNTNTSQAAGYIAEGRSISASGQGLFVGPVGISGAMARTISGWVQGTANIVPWASAFGFNTGTWSPDGYFDIECDGFYNYCLHICNNQWSSQTGVRDQAWHHVAATYENGQVQLFVDGALSTSASYTINTVDQFQMGYRGDQATTWLGMIDEVRVSRNRRSSGWIKLSYENQRSDDKLVTIAGACVPPSITKQPSAVTVDEGAVASFTVNASGTGLTYQWQRDDGRGWANIGGAVSNRYSFNASMADNGNDFRCIISGTCGTVTSAAARLTVRQSGSKNPLVLRAAFIDQSHVRFTITQYSGLPVQTPLPDPYVDSVCVWYAAGGYPSSPNLSDPNRVSFSLKDMKNAGAEPYQATVEVPPLSGDPDSSYFFAISCLWRNPDLVPEFVAGNGDKVLMFDTAAFENPLQFGEPIYTHAASKVNIVIVNVNQIPSVAKDLGIWYGFTSGVDFSLPQPRVTWIPVASIEGVTYSYDIIDREFLSDKRPLYYAVTLRNASGRVTSYILDTVEVGAVRPANTQTLTATAVNAHQIALQWSQRDTVQIWYGRSPVPLVHTLDTPEYRKQFRVIHPPAHLNYDTVSVLEADTRYHFGLQVYGKESLLWSMITENSSDSAITLGVDSSRAVPNTIVFREAFLDVNKPDVIKISYRIGRGGIPTGAVLHIGVRTGFTHPPQTYSVNIDAFKVEKWEDTLSLWLRDGLKLDTTYYFSLWLRQAGGPWAEPTDSSTGSLAVSNFTQAVVFMSGTDESDTIADGKVIVRKLSQKDWEMNGIIKAYYPPAGLIRGMALPGGVAFTFDVPNVNPFEVGIRYDSVPGGASASQIRMYRVTAEGKVMVEHGSYQDGDMVWTTVSNATFRDAFMLFVDTVAPVLTFNPAFTDTGAVAVKNQDIENRFSITDNIANVKWTFMYGRGNEGWKTRVDNMCVDYVSTGSGLIKGEDVLESYGVRALIIVTDAVHRDTINISRRVRCVDCDAFGTTALTWTPVWSTAELDSTNVGAVLASFTRDGKPFYDTMFFRLFRWTPCDQPGGGCWGRWSECGSGNADQFRFVPGRVYWLKTLEGRGVIVRNGTTTSLKEPFRIRLSAKSWNDIGLPLKFDVMLSDIIKATGSGGESLQFIRWVKDGDSYRHEELYADGIPGLEDSLTTARLLWETQKTAYSVYVPGDQDIDLLIPPIPPALSGKGLFKRPQRDGWSIRIVSRVRDSRRLADLRCGYMAGGKGVTFYPLRPSFANVGCGFADRAGKIWSHAIAHEYEDGGAAFELVHFNRGAAPADMTFRMEDTGRVPADMSARIFVPEKGSYADKAEEEVTVPAGSEKRHWVVVGTAAYLQQFAATFAGRIFAFLGVWPNPFSQRVAINFRVPEAGLDELRITVYDMHGRTVWEQIYGKGLRPGLGRAYWHRRDMQGRKASAGVYFVRVNARETGSTQVKSMKTRLICLQ